MFQGFYPSEPSPRRHHELVAELTAPRDPHLHFTTFENSGKISWINKCLTDLSKCYKHFATGKWVYFWKKGD